MGSWNYTCGVSNLSIVPEDEVALIFISETTGRMKNGCGIVENATPVSFPIFCTYDDYGRFTPFKSENESEKLLIDYFKLHMFELEEEKNKKAAKKDLLDWEYLLDLLQEERFMLQGVCFQEDRFAQGSTPSTAYARKVVMFPILKSIYDKIMSSSFIPMSVFEDEKVGLNEDRGCVLVTHHVNLIKTGKAQPLFSEDVRNKLKEINANSELSISEKDKLKQEVFKKAKEFAIDKEDVAFHELDGYGPVAGIKDLIRKFIWDAEESYGFYENISKEDADFKMDTILPKIKEIIFLSSAFDSMRLQWSSVGGLGGQDINHDAIIQKSKFILEAAEKKAECYGDSIWD